MSTSILHCNPNPKRLVCAGTNPHAGRGTLVARWSSRLAIALALAGLLQTPGLTATVPPGVVLHATQQITRNNGSEPESLDPALVESVGAANVIRDLFEGLTATEASGKIVPGVAERWKQTDPLTWVFSLRANARWSNGDAVTASDFVYAFRRLLDPKTGSKYARTLGDYFLHGKDVANGKRPPTELGIKALDKQTLEIRTAAPITFLPDLMAHGNLSPVHQKSLEAHGRDWTKPGNLVSNGAYVLKQWQVNNRLVIEKNPQYWEAETVVLSRVTYLPIEDGNADVKLFESGENDWVYQLPPGTFEKTLQKYPKETRNSPMLGLRYYSFQTQSPFFKDLRVRKALTMVLDRELLAERVTADGQAPAYGLMIKGIEGARVTAYEWAQWPMAQRVAQAKALLQEAGVAPGAKFRFIYNTSEYHKKMAIFAASEWKTKLGLQVELEAMEFKVLIKRRHDGSFEMARNGWIADYNDATTFLALVKCDSDQNENFNCNREAEKLIEQGAQQTDPAKRSALLTQASEMIMADYPMIPLLQYSLPRLVKSYVGGYSTANLMDRFRSKDLYIIKH